MTQWVEVDQTYGGDISVSAVGDVLTVSGSAMTRQLVLRRLLTNPGDYLAHPEYGAGLPGLVGSLVDVAQVEGIILGQMRLEAGVAQTPPPVVTVTPIASGISVLVQYADAGTGAPTVLAFNVVE